MPHDIIDNRTRELAPEINNFLADSVRDQPYRFFAEADAVDGLQRWVTTCPEMAQTYRAADGFETSLLHREIPTFFRRSQERRNKT